MAGGVSWVRAVESWTEPRMFAVPQTVHSSRQKIGCPSLIPRMGGSYGASSTPVSCPHQPARTSEGSRASGATLAHGLALGTLHRPAETWKDLRSVTETQPSQTDRRLTDGPTIGLFSPSPNCPTPVCRTETQPNIASVTSTQNSDYWTGLPFWDSWPVPRSWAIQLKNPPILLPLIGPRFCSSC